MTHILFTYEMDCNNNPEYSVKKISELNFDVSDSNNFKGTEKGCNEEGQRLVAKFEEATYVKPHYNNADYGSIYDY